MTTTGYQQSALHNESSQAPLIVVITGAAGRIAYALIPLVCNGSTFGMDRKIDLRLIDVEFSMVKLQGVLMEIEDSNYHLLDRVSITSSSEGFANADVAVLLGGYPRMPGMERKDLIEKNAEGMRAQGLSLDKYASRDVKVLVVANPANTNMLVLLKTVKNIPQGNFTCLTRLDEERLRNMVAVKINQDLCNSEYEGSEEGKERGRESSGKVSAKDVKDVFIFGNHSTTQVPYIDAGTVTIKGEVKKVKSFFSKDETNDLIKQIQNRGGEIIKKQGLSSGLSAAGAITRHLKDLFTRLTVDPVDPVGPKGEDGVKLFSAGVLSDGNTYGVPEGIVFSFPCYLNNGEVKIFEGLELDESLNERLHVSVAELQGERNEAEAFLNSLTSSSSSTPSPKL